MIAFLMFGSLTVFFLGVALLIFGPSAKADPMMGLGFILTILGGAMSLAGPVASLF